MSTAFVTGGSGFIGGALIERLVAEGWTVRALARCDAVAKAVREHSAPSRCRATSTTCSRCATAPPGADVAFHFAAHLGEWGTAEDFERGNVDRHANALRAAAEAGRPPLRPLRHRGGADGRRAAGERRRDRAAAARLEGAVLARRRRWPSRRSARQRATASRPSSSARGSSGARATRRSCRRSSTRSSAGASPGSAAARTVTSTTHVDNVVEGLMLAAREGRARGGLLRHRRRAGGLPRVRHRLLRPRASSRRPQPARPGRGAAGRHRRGRWRLLPLPGAPPLTRLRALAVLAGVHDRHLEGSRASSATRRSSPRPGPGRAANHMRIAVGSDHAGFHLKEHVPAGARGRRARHRRRRDGVPRLRRLPPLRRGGRAAGRRR